MRFVYYNLSYQRLKPNSFVNNLVPFETSSYGSLSLSFLTITWHLYDAFSSSLNTITFDYSTMKWFIYSSRKAYMRGPPSSLIQHWKELWSFSFVTHSAQNRSSILLLKMKITTTAKFIKSRWSYCWYWFAADISSVCQPIAKPAVSCCPASCPLKAI